MRNKLSARQVAAARYQGRDFKMADGDGLTLFVRARNRYWWFRYRFAGKARTLSLGTYPEVSLAEARRRRDAARQLLAEGIDPVAHRRAQRREARLAEAQTFEAVAREWWEVLHVEEVTAHHARATLRRLERDIFPQIGRRRIGELTPPEVLEVLRRIENSGRRDTARRARSDCGRVFRYAVQTGRAQRDPTQDLRGGLRPKRTRHRPAVTEPEELAELMRAIRHLEVRGTTRDALRVLAMLFPRPGELCAMRWADLDREKRLWRYHPFKGGEPFFTPLPRQAWAILEARSTARRGSEFVFPGLRSRHRPLTTAALNEALARAGFRGRMVGHGFRATARTLLVEVLGWSAEVVEMQLAHRVRDIHGRAYNRTQWLEQRGRMLQQWADYLEALEKPRGSVAEFRNPSAPVAEDDWRALP